MKFTLVTFIAIVGAASAISVDAGLIKRQCIANGGLCFTSIADTKKPCCGGLICKNKPQPNTNICEPEPSPSSVAKRADEHDEELQKRSDAPAAPQPRGMPQIPDNEPRWG
ncbi:ec20 protein [Colletotrichum kahawae]|uniref:Ec20 protein n=1 Tax=Colletotrichum kahawae TaxID=34407 RepID=A0AAE0D080_COLKA|nr:ec20 protein [Colletotrichum kahawae]